VIWRLCTGRTETAGGGVPCAMAASQQTGAASATSAAVQVRVGLKAVLPDMAISHSPLVGMIGT